jgi:hypothetical protein
LTASISYSASASRQPPAASPERRDGQTTLAKKLLSPSVLLDYFSSGPLRDSTSVTVFSRGLRLPAAAAVAGSLPSQLGWGRKGGDRKTCQASSDPLQGLSAR